MLRCMPKQLNQIDRVFQALADPTRRAILERLSRGPVSMTELAQPFPMAPPSRSTLMCSKNVHWLVPASQAGYAPISSRQSRCRARRSGWKRNVQAGNSVSINWIVISLTLRRKNHDSTDATSTRPQTRPDFGTHCRRPAGVGLDGLDNTGTSQKVVHTSAVENRRL